MSGSTPDAQDLTTLARAKFNKLSDSELKLLRAATTGEYAYCGPSDSDDDSGNDPAQASGWGAERSIRATLIRWLCVDHTAKGLVDPRGIQVHAARIADALDLSHATVPFPLTFENCLFASRMTLLGAQLEALSLKASRTAAIGADALKVRGNLSFRNGIGDGEVRLPGANIGGNLECQNGTLTNAGGVALHADGIKVMGSVFLRHGFNAEGEVRLTGAGIGGNLECDNATFKKPPGIAIEANAIAIQADGIKVTGSVFLRYGFNAEGEVRLRGADIGGNLECDRGTFRNTGGVALSASGIKVIGSMFLRNDFSVEGEVRLIRAKIGGQFGWDGGQFAPASAVNVEQASITGTFFWQNVRWNVESEPDAETNSPVPGPTGRLNLRHTTVGPMVDDQNSWPSTGRLQLDGFVYARIAAGPDDAKSRLEWLSRQERGFYPQPYRQLAKVLREAGDDSGARRVLIAMENSRLKYDLPWWSWPWAWVLRATIGYGYRPFRAGYWVALFVLVGFFVFSWGQEAGVLFPDRDAAVYQPFNGFVYSLETFLPLVDLQHAKHWLPGAELRPQGPVDLLGPLAKHRPFEWLPDWEHQFGRDFGEYLRWYFWVHILAGWFFTTMFVAGVTGLVRKD